MECSKELLRRELYGLELVNVQEFWKKYFSNRSGKTKYLGLIKGFEKRTAEEDMRFPEVSGNFDLELDESG
ncbi:Bgt-51727 [Blumeria graminis f. sp. tritici]|uniref:Bgt-51727 n=1 Tax=Blumeria graminis f. sp. tritici TaxID=62690 RepID=A0A9X9LAD2_BLUGR|nr:Bgt-51727 [Blumeria graminis f. sp. tritici]